MDKIGVLIVDDHAVVRQGLRTLLELQEDIEVVGEAANGREAIDQTAELLPDVVLMDLVMPEIDGIEATRTIKAACPSTQVIPAIKAGALSYLLKNVSPGDLVRAVQAASRGEAQLDPEIAKKLMEEVSSGSKQQSSEALTERELGVLQLIAKGQSNRAIGEELVISEKTVKTHVSNILSKLHLADRTQAAIFALREGLASEQ